MMEGYLSVNDVAKKWGLSPRRVRGMCQEGKIVGVDKLGREWAIPEDAERPEDGRISTGEYKNWRKKE
ncbi:MAG: helix-turn-helix domain-containing protein [Clostridium sp.]|nr:helix-turn-helix domain-containing protein [Clostridium sp.]